MVMTQDIGATFRALHRPGTPFTLANAWDAGSARVLVALGAQAIGTSSAAHAFTLGRPDCGKVTRDEALAHAADLVAAVSVPISGDFEDGFGRAPEAVAETVRGAAEVGLAGCSVEDTDFTSGGALPFEETVERIKAGVAAARALPLDFVFVARADGVLTGAYDLDEAIRRIRAFEAVGADCVYVPLPVDRAGLARVCASVTCPVNALAAGPFSGVTRAEFAALGVARISLGAALARVTQRALIEAATALLDHGDFSLLGNGASGGTVDALLAKGAR